MNIKLSFMNKEYVLVGIYSILSMTNQSNFTGIFYTFMGVLVWLYTYQKSRKKYNSKFAIIRLIMLSIPTSFINILNGPYSDLPISWFNIFSLFLVMLFIVNLTKKGKITVNYLSVLALILLVIGLILIMNSYDYVDAIKQYINIAITLLFIIIGNNMKSYLDKNEKKLLQYDYVGGALICYIGLLIQYIIINFRGIEVGTYFFLGGNRHTYAFIFSDFSFLSLYLASGAMLLFGMKNTNVVRSLGIYFPILIMLVSSILTSARTGVVSFVIVLAIYSFINFFDLMFKGSIKAFLLIVLNIVVLIGTVYIFTFLRPDDLLNDSGRGSLNFKAIELFQEYPFMGIGFGVSTFGERFGIIPHNMLFQALAQGGLIYTLPIIALLFISLVKAYKINKNIFYVLLTIFVGAMFIPDIFNSRFLAAIYLLLSVESYNEIIASKVAKNILIRERIY